MNNKEFITELAARCGYNQKDTQKKMDALLECVTEHLCDDDTIMISNFGTFETKKRLERVLVNPNNGQRMLVPPKIVVSFKPSANLKNQL